MADDPNEVLKDIAAMQGVPLSEELEQQDTATDEGVADGQEEERLEEGSQASDEGVQREVEPTAEGEEDEDSVEARYARLLEAHNAMAAQMLELQSRGYPVGSPPASAQDVTPPPAVPPSSSPQAPPPSQYALNEQLLEKALVEDDPVAMKQVITGLVQHVENLVLQAREQTRESVLRDIPSVATSVARHQLQMMEAIKDFYTENKDLAPYQHVVGAVANEITSKEPQLTIGDALDKTATEVRRRLGLRKQALATPPDRKPAFPSGVKGSRKPGAPVLTGIRADIAKMANARP